MGKATSQPKQAQEVPYGTLLAASPERILGKKAPKISQHTVQAGEGLWTIAKKYNPLAPVTEIARLVQKIVELNKLGSVKALIAPGQVLQVPSTVNLGNKKQAPQKVSPKINSKVKDKLRALELKMMGQQPDNTKVRQPPIFEGKKVNKKITPKKVKTPQKAKKRVKPDFSLNGIKDVLKRKGYKFYEEEGKVNLIAVRMDDTYDNKFSDKLFVVQKVKGKTRMEEIPWTTMGGLYGHGGAYNPLSAKETGTSVSGLATIVEGQYENVWRFNNNYQNIYRKPYLQQVRNFKFYRDANKDNKLDRGKIYEGNIGLFGHIMGSPGIPNNVISGPGWGKPWSQGCQGVPDPHFNKLLKPLRTHSKSHSSNVTYTMLHYNDFID